MLKLRIEMVFAFLVLALCVAGYFEATSYRAQSAYLPTAVMVFGVLLSAIWALQCILAQIKRPTAAENSPETEKENPSSDTEISYTKMGLFIVSGTAYAWLVPMLGYFSATLIFIPLVSVFLGFKKKIVLLTSTLLFVIVLNTLFVQVLRVPMLDELPLQILGIN